MVKVVVKGVEFDAVSLHDIDVMSYFPEGTGNINGVLECLSDVFDNEEFDELLQKMTVPEVMTVWENWSSNSNFDFVYQNVFKAMQDQKPKVNRLGRFLIISWLLTGVTAIVALTLLFV